MTNLAIYYQVFGNVISTVYQYKAKLCQYSEHTNRNILSLRLSNICVHNTTLTD